MGVDLELGRSSQKPRRLPGKGWGSWLYKVYGTRYSVCIFFSYFVFVLRGKGLRIKSNKLLLPILTCLSVQN